MTCESQTAFLVYARTGCTCCNNENHYRGPYSSREVAERQVNIFRETRLLASQYARQGVYEISEHPVEILPDGRLIIESRVYSGFADDGYDDYIGHDL